MSGRSPESGRGHSGPRLTLAANNAEVGGGEVMLLTLARTARTLGVDVDVVGPDHGPGSGGVLDVAESAGFAVTRLAGERTAYLRALRDWHRHHRGVPLWCNGLVPAAATAGRSGRVVHLHQDPRGAHRLLTELARTRATATLVPSSSVAGHVHGSRPLWNWTDDLAVSDRPAPDPAGPFRLGFLGRPSAAKGVIVLARAIALLERSDPGRFRLTLAGEPRFVDPGERAHLEQALTPVDHLVDHLGWVERSEFFARVDLAVFPSVAPESFGLVVAEAMATGTPFVISDAGALPEVAGSDHPWVSRAGDPQDLARVIQVAASSAPASQEGTLEAARNRWKRYFSPSAGTARLRDVLTDLDVL